MAKETQNDTIASYDAAAIEWSNQHSDGNFWGRELDLFQKHLPAGKVLDICVGGGRDAKELIKRGYQYEGVDVSHGLLEVARQNIPGVKVEYVKSIDNLPFTVNHADGVWSSATLVHISDQELPLVLREFKRITKPEGVIFISTKEGSKKGVTEEEQVGSVIMRRHFFYYSQEELARALLYENYSILDLYPHTMGHTTWLCAFARVNKYVN